MSKSINKPTQAQMFYAAQRDVAIAQQDALWLCGLIPDKSGNVNPNPLTINEVERIVMSKKLYSHLFEHPLRIMLNIRYKTTIETNPAI